MNRHIADAASFRFLLGVLCLTIFASLTFAADVVRIQPNEASSAASHKVQPEYPEMAKQMKLKGKVEIDVTIDEAGGVEAVKVLSGNPLLTGAARRALKQWKFTPIERNGKPVKAAAVFAFDFK